MLKAVIFIFMALLPLQLFAYEPHDYTYLQTEYWSQSQDGFESDGYSVSGSLHTSQGLLLSVGYAEGTADDIFGVSLSSINADLDYSGVSVFLGGAHQATERASIWGGLGYTRERYEYTDPEFEGVAKGHAFSFGGGVRYWLMPMLEINGGAAYLYVDSDDLAITENDYQVAAGFRFHPLLNLSIGTSIQYLIDSEADQFSADVRWKF